MVIVRTVAGLVLLAAWWIVGVLTIIGLMWFSAFCLQHVAAEIGNGLVNVTIYAVPICIGVAMSTAGNLMVSVLPSNHVRRDSIAVERDEAPEVWRLVDKLADEVGCAPPDLLRLVPEANAKAVERTALLGLVGGTRILYLGAPLLFALDAGELSAVLCHELAHHLGGHTRFGALSIRVTDALDSTLASASGKPAGGWVGRICQFAAKVPLLVFSVLYREIMVPTHHRHELEADKAAERVVGTAAMIRTLYAYNAAGGSWRDFEVRLLQPGLALGVLPDDLFAAYAEFIRQPRQRSDMAAFWQRPLPSVHSAFDSHPTLAERARGLREGGHVAAPRDAAPQTRRLADVGPLATVLARQMAADACAASIVGRAGGDILQTMPWKDWLTASGDFTTAGQRPALLPPAKHRAVSSTRSAKVRRRQTGYFVLVQIVVLSIAAFLSFHFIH